MSTCVDEWVTYDAKIEPLFSSHSAGGLKATSVQTQAGQ